jgi:hypothetical protein
MALHVLCPKCGVRYAVADEQAGSTATCPACHTLARIPAIDAPTREPSTPGAPPPAGPSPPPFAAETYTPAYGGEMPGRSAAATSLEVHRYLIAIFGLSVGLLSMLWAVLCAFLAACYSIVGALPDMPREPEASVGAAGYAVMAGLTLLVGILQIVAALPLFWKKRIARGLGITSAVISCISIWGCCIYPFYLAFGIYSLIILCGRSATEMLDR